MKYNEDYLIPDIPILYSPYDMTEDTGPGYVPEMQPRDGWFQEQSLPPYRDNPGIWDRAVRAAIATGSLPSPSWGEIPVTTKDMLGGVEPNLWIPDPAERSGSSVWSPEMLGRVAEDENYQSFPAILKPYGSKERKAEALMREALPLTPEMNWVLDRTRVINRPFGGSSGVYWPGDSDAPGAVDLSVPSQDVALHEYTHAFHYQVLGDEFLAQFNKEFEDFIRQAEEDQYTEARTEAQKITNNLWSDDVHRFSPTERYAELIVALNGDISKLPPNLRRFYAPMLGNGPVNIPKWTNTNISPEPSIMVRGNKPMSRVKTYADEAVPGGSAGRWVMTPDGKIIWNVGFDPLPEGFIDVDAQIRGR